MLPFIQITLRQIAFILIVPMLISCGGDGGSDPATTTNTGDPAGLQIDTNTVQLVKEQGEDSPSIIIKGSVNPASVTTNTLYLTVSYTNTSISSVAFNKTGKTTGEISIIPRLAHSISPKSYTDTITVMACLDKACNQHVPGSPQIISFNYKVNKNQPVSVVTVSDVGVAFADIPTVSTLTRNLIVKEITTTPAGWKATSAAPNWLSVTASGNTGDALVLTANVTNLLDGYYQTNVTVSSNSANLTNSETINVGLYKSNLAPATSITLTTPAYNVVVDPVRPYLYVSYGNANINVYHIYTGVLVNTLSIRGGVLFR